MIGYRFANQEYVYFRLKKNEFFDPKLSPTPFYAMKNGFGNLMCQVEIGQTTRRTVYAIYTSKLIKCFGRWLAHCVLTCSSHQELVIDFVNHGSECLRLQAHNIAKNDYFKTRLKAQNCIDKNKKSAFEVELASLVIVITSSSANAENIFEMTRESGTCHELIREDFNFLVDLEFEKMRLQETQNV